MGGGGYSGLKSSMRSSNPGVGGAFLTTKNTLNLEL